MSPSSGSNEGMGPLDTPMERSKFLGHVGRLAVGTAFAGLVGVGCGDDETGGKTAGAASGGTDAPKPKVIGFEHPNSNIPLWGNIMYWSKVEADRRGVELLIPNDQGKLDRQIATLNTWIAQKPDAIICYALEPTSIDKIAGKAVAAGIEWVSYAGEIPNDQGQVDLNNRKSGQLLGETAAKFVNEVHGGTAKAIYLNCPACGAIGRERDSEALKAFRANAPDATIVATQQAVDPQTGLQVVGSVLSAHPDVKVVMGINDDGALGAFRAFRDRGHAEDDPEIFIGGQDGSKQALELIKKGTMYRACVALSMKELGRECIDLPYQLASGEAELETKVNVPIHLVTQTDTALLDKLIGEMDKTL